LSAAQPAAILGSIVDDSGKPVQANVRISKLGGSSIKGGPPTSVGVRTAVDGTFGFPSLGAGTYVLCAQALAGNYLDPCIWSASPPTVNVAVGQLIKGFAIVARKGASVNIRLADDDHVLLPTITPNTALSLVKPPQAAPYVQVGVLTLHKTLEPAPLVGADANGLNHQATIPSGQPVEIHAMGQGVTMTDSNGAALNIAGARFTVNQAATDPPGLITIHVHK
jgi:hypothetical protein